MNDLLREAEAYIRELFAGEASGHDVWHTLRVCRLAARLARAEGADEDLCQLAALLHDADDAKLFPETAAEQRHARDFLSRHGLPQAEIDRICHIIAQVSFKGTDSVVPDSLEGKCVQDADRLDAIGAIGIARTFAFGGSRGRAIYEPGTQPRLHMDEKAYRAASGCTIHHFDEKLLLLRDMMNTPSARALAEGRHRVMEDFLSEFYAEWEGTR